MTVQQRAIKKFAGKWAFLSNDFQCNVTVWGKTFPSVTHAFVLSVYDLPIDGTDYWMLTGCELSALAKDAPRKPNISHPDNNILYTAMCSKFRNNAQLQEELLRTGNRDIKGASDEDHLVGLMLMQIRSFYEFLDVSINVKVL